MIVRVPLVWAGIALSMGVGLGFALRYQPRRDLSAIERWLSCEECAQGEREAVVALGDDAIGALDAALQGLSEQQLANVDSQTVRGLRLAGPGAAPTPAIAQLFRENFVALRQQRAAIALGDIGTEDAIEVLRGARDKAVERRYREDVIRVIESALPAGEHLQFQGAMSVDSSGGLGRGGRGRGYGPLNTAGYGDTVVVFANRDDTAARWSGDETVSLRGGPLPNGVFIDRIGDSVLRYFAFAEPGAYTVEIGRLGTDDSKAQTAPLLIAATSPGVLSRTRGPPTLRRFDPATFPDTVLVALNSYSDDTTKHYQIQPAAAVRIRSTGITTQSVATASLRWLSCGGDVIGVGNTIYGTVVNEQGTPISAAVIRAPLLGAGATTNASGAFALSIPPGPVARTVDIDVSAIGYTLVRHRIAPAPDTVRIGLVAAATAPTNRIARFSTTHRIAAGECRQLEIGIPGGSGRRLIQLIVESM